MKLRASGDDVPRWDRFGRLLRALHVAGAQTEAKFAIDFPDWMIESFSLGDRLRIFGENSTELNKVYDSLESCAWLEDEVEAGRIRTVKDVKGYCALMHHGFGGGVIKARGALDLQAVKATEERKKLTFFAKTQALPYIKILSSSGNQFTLRLERIMASESDRGDPNGYGVSRPTQIIALPIMS
jgi:CRISPR-associated endoribonuclease Cas6/Csy4 subtype I-F